MAKVWSRSRLRRQPDTAKEEKETYVTSVRNSIYDDVPCGTSATWDRAARGSSRDNTSSATREIKS